VCIMLRYPLPHNSGSSVLTGVRLTLYINTANGLKKDCCSLFVRRAWTSRYSRNTVLYIANIINIIYVVIIIYILMFKYNNIDPLIYLPIYDNIIMVLISIPLYVFNVTSYVYLPCA